MAGVTWVDEKELNLTQPARDVRALAGLKRTAGWRVFRNLRKKGRLGGQPFRQARSITACQAEVSITLGASAKTGDQKLVEFWDRGTWRPRCIPGLASPLKTSGL